MKQFPIQIDLDTLAWLRINDAPYEDTRHLVMNWNTNICYLDYSSSGHVLSLNVSIEDVNDQNPNKIKITWGISCDRSDSDRDVLNKFHIENNESWKRVLEKRCLYCLKLRKLK